MSHTSGPHFNPPPRSNTPSSLPPSESQPADFSSSSSSDEEASKSAWSQMFPGGATKEEMNKFISNFLNMMIYEFKRADEKWKKSQDRLKKIEMGEDPD
ncbi:MAG: hypothetical protein EBZ47_03005 [Chlamydiae bacterium]|nr:hypothetical protein [Chlamydiota bacterium]